jgi:hypothetical protein
VDNPEPRAQYLNVVLRQIERTALRIPRFQRHFVWDERDVLELLGSIEKGYPIGSILTWKVERADNYFSGYRTNPFPEADENVGSFEVILDGAQRLSSLYGCLRNPNSKAVYQVAYDVRQREFVHVTPTKPTQMWFVPMDALFDSRRFLAIQAALSDLDDSELLLARALDLYSTFQDYQIPIIALSSAVLEDVVEVFRRVNSSGTALSSVDFVRALTWQSSFDLEVTFDLFEERYQATPLEGFTEDFLIRCLAITANLSLDSRDIVQLKALSNRQNGLATEVTAMQNALDLMADFLNRINITNLREVPYEAQRLLLYSMMHHHVADDPVAIENWFWRSTFAEEHQSKPESYITRLVREMRSGDVGPTFEVRKPIERDLFATRIRRGGAAVSTGYDLLMRKTAAGSLLSGKPFDAFEVVYVPLYTRQELQAAAARSGEATAANPQLLANLVLLSHDDSVLWKRARAKYSLADIYARRVDDDPNIESVWASQGLTMPLNGDPSDILSRRSAVLLSRVIPEVQEQTERM